MIQLCVHVCLLSSLGWWHQTVWSLLYSTSEHLHSFRPEVSIKSPANTKCIRPQRIFHKWLVMVFKALFTLRSPPETQPLSGLRTKSFISSMSVGWPNLKTWLCVRSVCVCACVCVSVRACVCICVYMWVIWVYIYVCACLPVFSTCFDLFGAAALVWLTSPLKMFSGGDYFITCLLFHCFAMRQVFISASDVLADRCSGAPHDGTCTK